MKLLRSWHKFRLRLITKHLKFYFFPWKNKKKCDIMCFSFLLHFLTELCSVWIKGCSGYSIEMQLTYMASCKPPSLPNFMSLVKVATKPKVFLKLKTHKSNYSLILKINCTSVMLRNHRKEIRAKMKYTSHLSADCSTYYLLEIKWVWKFILPPLSNSWTPNSNMKTDCKYWAIQSMVLQEKYELLPGSNVGISYK